MKRTAEQIADEWLVLRSQEGSVGALNLLLKRWQPRLIARAFRLIDDPDAARDVLQESLIAIAAGVRSLKDPASFPGWAFQIVSNKSRDWIRKRARDRRLSDTEQQREELTISQTGDSPTDILREAMTKLDPADRELLRLHYYEGFSLQDIAGIESIPVGTVKSRLFHARELLKEKVSQMKT